MVRNGNLGQALPNFSFVRLVGCFTQGADNTWTLTNSTEPTAAKDQPSTPEELEQAEAQPPGTESFRLVSIKSFKPDLHIGHKVEAKGLLYREPGESRLNVTSLEGVALTCGQ